MKPERIRGADGMQLVSQNRSFGGTQSVFRHWSNACQTEMTFGLYLPPQAEHG